VLLGVISDTHGYVDERVLPALAGVDLILHGGDVGSAEVLQELKSIAPLYAVEGNNDVALGLDLPPRLLLEIEGHRIEVVHQLPHYKADCEVVVHGHSHKTRNEWRDGTLLLNPGAAGRVGFHALQSIALLRLEQGRRPEAEIVVLGPRLPSAARRPRSSR
jgi:putative phosphoesterase